MHINTLPSVDRGHFTRRFPANVRANQSKQPKSRDSYVAMLYDGIGRSIATANYGTNNDAGPPTWPTTVPSSIVTVLVSLTSCNDKGEAEGQADPG